MHKGMATVSLCVSVELELKVYLSPLPCHTGVRERGRERERERKGEERGREGGRIIITNLALYISLAILRLGLVYFAMSTSKKNF